MWAPGPQRPASADHLHMASAYVRCLSLGISTNIRTGTALLLHIVSAFLRGMHPCIRPMVFGRLALGGCNKTSGVCIRELAKVTAQWWKIIKGPVL